MMDNKLEEAAAEPMDALRYVTRSERFGGGYFFNNVLRYVEVAEIVEIEGDAETWARRMGGYDAQDAREPLGFNDPDWHATPTGKTFSVRWDLGATQDCIEWECRPLSLAHHSTYYDYETLEVLGMDKQETLYFARIVYGIGNKTDLLKALEVALLAYLQANASKLTTPRDADLCAAYFIESVSREAATMRRKEYMPDILSLVCDAVSEAQPTPTGIDSLDSILGGGLVPGIYVVAGDPGAGKTALAVQTLMYAAHKCAESERAAYFMLDQGGAREIAKRLVSLAWAIDAEARGEKPKEARLSDSAKWTTIELSQGSTKCDGLTNKRAVLFDLMDGSTNRMMDALDKLVRYCRVSLRLVVVDYYQLLCDVGGYEYGETIGASVAAEPAYASEVIRTLRTWATRHGTPVLLVGQFTKESIERHAKGTAPKMTDLLGSVDVPYQAEAVITLTNAHDGSGVVELADVKHRHAGNETQGDRKARLVLDGEHGYFSELD